MPPKLPVLEQHPPRPLPSPRSLPSSRPPPAAAPFRRTLDKARSASKPKAPASAHKPATTSHPKHADDADKAPAKKDQTDASDPVENKEDTQPSAKQPKPADSKEPHDGHPDEQPPAKQPPRATAPTRAKRNPEAQPQADAAAEDTLELTSSKANTVQTGAAAQLAAESAQAEAQATHEKPHEPQQKSSDDPKTSRAPVIPLPQIIPAQQAATAPAQSTSLEAPGKAADAEVAAADIEATAKESHGPEAAGAIALSATAQLQTEDDLSFDSALEAAKGPSEKNEKAPTDADPQSQAAPATLQDKPQLQKPQAAPQPQQPSFVEENHPRIISGIRQELLPNGGTMRIRLDPPELGALQVKIEMRDGHLTASFETSNDDATRLLSHSLTQLKQALESHGVSVEKLQVQQSPKGHAGGQSGDSSREQQSFQDSQARQDQQRRQTLQKLWEKLRDGSDPLDMMA